MGELIYTYSFNLPKKLKRKNSEIANEKKWVKQ